MPDAFDDLQQAIDAAEQAAATGNLATAEVHLHEVLRLQIHYVGELDPDVAATIHKLAIVNERTGRIAEAESDVPPRRRGGLSGAAGRRPAGAAVQRRPDRLPGGDRRGGGAGPGAAAGAGQCVAARPATGSRAGARVHAARRVRRAGHVHDRNADVAARRRLASSRHWPSSR